MLKVRVGWIIFAVLVSVAAIVSFSGNQTVQARAPQMAKVSPSPGDKKSFSDYKGVAIGNTTTDVRQKLGSPNEKGDGQDFYSFSGGGETVQFYYDGTKQVTAIMITYMSPKSAPTAIDVFGEEVAPKEDGSVFKMVRYPKEGYWISYNRSGGKDAIVSIAIQKI